MPASPVGARNLPDRAAQVPRIAEVDSGNGRYRPRHNLFGSHFQPQRQPHQNCQLGTRIESANILCRIGLGIPLRLRFFQHIRVFRPVLHLAQDEVAGAIQNAFNALNAIAGQPLLKAGNHGDSARDRRAVLQVPAFGRGQPLQFHAVKGNQLLVGRDHALARFQRPAYPISRRLKTARQFHHHVHIRGQHSVGVFAPHHARWNPVHTLALYAAVEDMRQRQALGLLLHQDARRRTAHRSKPEDRNPQRPASPLFQRCLGSQLDQTSGNLSLTHSRSLASTSLIMDDN